MDSSKKSLFSWALFDCAGGSFSAIIQTFVFAVYFTTVVAVNEIEGGVQWGMVNAIASFFIAIIGPVFGAIADRGGSRKPWIAFFAYLCMMCTALLWFVVSGSIVLGMTLVCLGIIGAESAFIFYSAMLRDVAGEKRVGMWSGIGWGCGYLGGMLSLVIALLMIDLDQPIRATFLFCAAWYFVFSLPLFLWTKDRPRTSKTLKEMVILGIGQFRNGLRGQRNLFRFLVARMFFIDGLTTLFAFGGVYAATTFAMSPSEVLIFGILLNITAGLGAFVFAFIDDLIGSKRTILIALSCLILLSIAILFIIDHRFFWIAGSLIGIFVGPVQAASRSYLARMVEPQLQNQMFGFLAFSGKATAFLGPLLVGLVIYRFSSIRAGMCVIPLFFITGLVLLMSVKDDFEVKSSLS